MQDKPEKCIVDSQGNAIKKDKNIKQFLTDSTKKILTVLLLSLIHIYRLQSTITTINSIF